MTAKINYDYYKDKDSYSDGDIENSILEIVKKQNDFTDILHTSNNWPILYHLSPVRRNLMNWYDFDADASLLEVGGGCGAFSGMFADKLHEVKVVELSKRRSEIIYNRHKEYDNLEVIVGNISDIEFDKKFDYITLIGVLEYAGKFSDSKAPYNAFLEHMKGLLKPGGRLLIAIENKFGLKYWSGAKEDHTGKFFDSIEGYSSSKDVQTFGKPELTTLLNDCGFNNIYFYYPMPDYKLPKVIYSDDYLPHIDAFFDQYSPNFDQDRYLLFDEREAYKNIIKNGMFPFFANSFLVEAKV